MTTSSNDGVMPFDPTMVYQDSETIGYLTSTLRALTWAVRDIMTDKTAVRMHGFSDLKVECEAPIDIEKYPYIQVMYKNTSFERTSLEGQPQPTWTDDDELAEYRLYMFKGQCTVNVYATTILERERLSDCLIARMSGVGDFSNKLISNEWINIHPNMATLKTPTANESWGTPWSEDLMTCFRSFTFELIGEFAYRKVGGVPEFITKIEVEGIIA